MNSTKTSCAEDLDASQLGEQHSACNCCATIEVLACQPETTHVAQISSRQLQCGRVTSRRREPDQLLWIQPYACYTVENAYGRGHTAIDSDYAFEEGCESYVLGVREACMKINSCCMQSVESFHSHHEYISSSLVQRRASSSAELPAPPPRRGRSHCWSECAFPATCSSAEAGEALVQLSRGVSWCLGGYCGGQPRSVSLLELPTHGPPLSGHRTHQHAYAIHAFRQPSAPTLPPTSTFHMTG